MALLPFQKRLFQRIRLSKSFVLRVFARFCLVEPPYAAAGMARASLPKVLSIIPHFASDCKPFPKFFVLFSDSLRFLPPFVLSSGALYTFSNSLCFFEFSCVFLGFFMPFSWFLCVFLDFIVLFGLFCHSMLPTNRFSAPHV